mmetsp:Transcript_12278/g.18549  ORF Transcript_12278/g.18549 Transcript_12278/m.18549 type:complete len:260 (-) Transcript_12278:10-789(-)
MMGWISRKDVMTRIVNQISHESSTELSMKVQNFLENLACASSAVADTLICILKGRILLLNRTNTASTKNILHSLTTHMRNKSITSQNALSTAHDQRFVYLLKRILSNAIGSESKTRWHQLLTKMIEWIDQHLYAYTTLPKAAAKIIIGGDRHILADISRPNPYLIQLLSHLVVLLGRHKIVPTQHCQTLLVHNIQAALHSIPTQTEDLQKAQLNLYLVCQQNSFSSLSQHIQLNKAAIQCIQKMSTNQQLSVLSNSIMQ